MSFPIRKAAFWLSSRGSFRTVIALGTLAISVLGCDSESQRAPASQELPRNIIVTPPGSPLTYQSISPRLAPVSAGTIALVQGTGFKPTTKVVVGTFAIKLTETAASVYLGPSQIAVIKTLWTDRAFGKPEFWNKTIHLEPSVGEWVERQGVSAVAMDCFPEKPFWMMTLTPAERGANHKRWLKAGIPMIQMLTALDRIGPTFTLIALPLKLQGMDGAPARVIGIEN